jgi:hypothetical protein
VTPPRIAVPPRITVPAVQAEQVTAAQAQRIISAQGLRRSVLVVRDMLDKNKIRQIIVRE